METDRSVDLYQVAETWTNHGVIARMVLDEAVYDEAYCVSSECTAYPKRSGGYGEITSQRPKLEVDWHIEDIQRSYYYLGGQRIALRVEEGQEDDVYWLHTDHLGSTSLLSDDEGDLEIGSTTRFLPFGDYRTEPSSDLTDKGYTGHAHNDLIGLVFMRARFYVPSVGRFASADSMVPRPTDPQSLNRFSYVNNRPLSFTDPDGRQDLPADTIPLDPVSWELFLQATSALMVTVAEATPTTMVVGSSATIYAGGMCLAAWALGDTGPDYPLPMEYEPFAIQPTYVLPGSNTLTIGASIVLAIPKGILSMADHLGYMFGSPNPSFPDPDDRHDPNRFNDPKENAEHIRNSLRGIKRNIGRQDLSSYLQEYLSEEQLTDLFFDLDNLVWDLQNQSYFFEQIGAELSEEILQLLTEMSYIVP